MAQQAFKIVLIGDSGAGKTSLIQRYCDEPFDPTSSVSLGVDCKVKVIVEDGTACVLTLWDTAGQERYYSLCKSCYRGAHAIIFVYDIGSYKSFQNMVKWWSDVEAMADSPDVVRMLVGNKADLRRVNGMEVTKVEALSWAKERGMFFGECSAKTKEGMNSILQTTVQELLGRPSLWMVAPTPPLLRRNAPTSCC